MIRMPKKESFRPTICIFPCPVCVIDSDIDLFEEVSRSTFYCRICSRVYICKLPLGSINVGEEVRYICPIDHTELEESPFRSKEIELLIEKAKEGKKK